MRLERRHRAQMARLVETWSGMGISGALLRTDGLCLVGAASLAFLMDAIGVPVAGIGFVDAHELALIAGVLFWSASSRPCWLWAAAAVHALFAATNLAHWEHFVSADIVAVGYATTAAHAVFVVLGGAAARAAAAGPGSLAGEPEAA